jgi:hypothetical protein
MQGRGGGGAIIKQKEKITYIGSFHESVKKI